MVTPIVSSRVKQSNLFTSLRVGAGDESGLEAVATAAGEAKIVNLSFAATGHRYNMINFQRNDNLLARTAIFTASAGTFFNEPAQPEWHIGHVALLQTEKAVNIKTAPLHLKQRS